MISREARQVVRDGGPRGPFVLPPGLDQGRGLCVPKPWRQGCPKCA